MHELMLMIECEVLHHQTCVSILQNLLMDVKG
jgi:hypothetical protein